MSQEEADIVKRELLGLVLCYSCKKEMPKRHKHAINLCDQCVKETFLDLRKDLERRHSND